MSNIQISNKKETLQVMEILVGNRVEFTPAYERDPLNGGHRVHLRYTDKNFNYVQVTPGNWPLEEIRSSIELQSHDDGINVTSIEEARQYMNDQLGTIYKMAQEAIRKLKSNETFMQDSDVSYAIDALDDIMTNVETYWDD